MGDFMPMRIPIEPGDEFRPLLSPPPPPPPPSAEPKQAPASKPAGGGRQDRPAAAAATESRVPTQDMTTLLLEAESRGRALAQAEMQSLMREVDTQRQALEAEIARVRGLADAITAVQDEMKKEYRRNFGEMVLAATRLVVDSAPAREAFFKKRLGAIADHLSLEREVTLLVPPAFGDLAESVVRGKPGWLVMEDSTIETGCVAECRSGRVDGTLPVALLGLEEAVREWLAQDGEEGEAP